MGTILKKRLAIILAVIMVAALLPVSALADPVDLDGHGVNGLAVTYEEGSWSASTGRISGSVTTIAETNSCYGQKRTMVTSTLNLKNDLEETALLEFDASVNLDGGVVTINGTGEVGHLTFVLEPGESIDVVAETAFATVGTTTIVLDGVKLTPDEDVTVTFVPSEHGSFTVNGTAVTDETEITQSVLDSFNLAASPDSGYRLGYWQSDSSWMRMSSPCSAYFSEEVTVTAVFIPATAPLFQVGDEYFTDLNDAVDYSQTANESRIVLAANGTLPAGDYTIPDGKTLLIPYNDAHTLYTTVPAVRYLGYVRPTAYRVLTMAEGASITVENGASVSLSGELSSKGQLAGYNGTPTGPDGRINMLSGSSITLENGAKLYCWGYIYGSGEVVAESGSTVYEAFQIKDFRGGTASSNVVNYAFIFNQYYVQNIEVPLKLYAGASELLYSAINIPSFNLCMAMSASFIGNNSMFTVTNGYIVKDYIEAEDMLSVEVHGDILLAPMVITTGLPSISSINTAQYVLPITNNIRIDIVSGTTTISQNIELLPGTEITIRSDAELNIASGKGVLLYDNDDWGNYTGSARLYVIGYSVANGATKVRTAASLKDAMIEVEGTLSVDGALLTSEGGADIMCSEGAGFIVLNTAPVDSISIYECENNSDQVTVTFYAAQLHNGDGSYTQTQGSSAGTEFFYCGTHDQWESGPHYTISFDANGGTGTMDDQVLCPDGGTLNANTFERQGYLFAGWNTDANGQGDPYSDGDSIVVTADTTLYAQWEMIPTYTVVWKNWDGTELETDEDVPYGDMPSYDGETPEKEGDAQYAYAFAGWTPEVSAVTGDAEYTAVFTETVNTYTVIWKNWDGTELETDEDVPYGDMPSYDGETPEKEGNAQYSYAFVGWTPAVDIVTGDAEYTAVFSETGNTYTVTFLNWDGTELETDEDVPYGDMPSYDGETPEKEADAQYTYAFIGWTPEVGEVTGDVIYTAQFSSTVRSYKITWVDGDNNEIYDEMVEYGETPVFDGSVTPTKSATAQYTYYFNETWSPEIVPVTGEAVYVAQFDSVVNHYTITFVNWDGEELQSTSVAYGETPVYEGETPEKEGDAQYSYAFIGWTPEIETVSGEKTYIAVFSEAVNTYTVTWKNWDGTELETDENVPYGTFPTYDGETPEKEADAQYTYTFIGWSPEVGEVTGDAEYTAVFTETVNTYTVTWKNWDGTELETDENVPYGDMPYYDGDTPEKQGNAQYSYAFVGWTPEVSAVTGDAEYTAVFTETVNEYTIVWIDGDGNTIKTEQLAYGETPVYDGEVPTKTATAQYSYSFAGWDPEIEAVTGDAEYTAVFTETVNEYTITFLNWDGEVLQSTDVPYGELPVYAGETPEKEGDAQFTYSFIGWDYEITAVEGEATYTAVYSETVNVYTVIWVDGDGNTIKTEEYEYGQLAVYIGDTPTKTATTQYSYEFIGWSPENGVVTGDVTYYAQFEEVVNEYEITWIDGNGSIILIADVPYGETPVYTGDVPIKNATAQYSYTFAGWDPEIVPVEGEATYTAVFTETVNEYTITFLNWDGEVLQSTSVAYGETPVYEGETPVKASAEGYAYVFAGWDNEIVSVTGETVYTAVFDAMLIGDINGDGFVRSYDALLILRHALGLITLTPEQQALADVDHDGHILSYDALLVLRASLELIELQ